MIKEIFKLIRKHKRFLITTHMRPDGDGLGSELALRSMLIKLGKSVQVINVGKPSKEYHWLPGFDKIIFDSYRYVSRRYDAVFVLDSGTFDRLGKLREILIPNVPIINIDHHPHSDYFGSINWVDPSVCAVGEMIYRLIKKVKVPIDKDMATNLYIALSTDTGQFSFVSTTPFCHLMARDLLKAGVNLRTVFKQLYENRTLADVRLWVECIRRMKLDESGRIAWTELTQKMYQRFNILPGDSQDYLQVLKTMKGVQIAILFREVATGSLPNDATYPGSSSRHKAAGRKSTAGASLGEIKVSIRTVPPIDAYKLVSYFGGGGHARAAGCALNTSIAKAQRLVLKKAREYLAKSKLS